MNNFIQQSVLDGLFSSHITFESTTIQQETTFYKKKENVMFYI